MLMWHLREYFIFTFQFPFDILRIYFDQGMFVIYESIGELSLTLVTNLLIIIRRLEMESIRPLKYEKLKI